MLSKLIEWFAKIKKYSFKNKQRCQFFYWNQQQCSLPCNRLNYCKYHLLKGIAVQFIVYFNKTRLLLSCDVPTTEYIVIDPYVIDKWKAGSELRLNILYRLIKCIINKFTTHFQFK
jgi:hypothetical protein